MSLAHSSSQAAATNDPQRSLNDALAAFRSALSADQQEALKNLPAEKDVDKVMIFTTELDQKAKGMRGPSMATRLHAVLEAVHLFSTVVDTFVSSNPEIAALVWGSVKLTMLIMINYTSYFAPMSKLFLTISTHCPRFTEYQCLFPISVRLQQALCNFHAAIVRCCQHVVQCMKRTWSQHLLTAILQSFDQEFKPDLDEIAKLAKEVKEEVTLAAIKGLQQEQCLQAHERKESSRSRYLLRRYIPSADEDRRVIQSRHSRQDREALLARLSSFDYLYLFKDACKKRRNGTAEWILTEAKFTQWQSGIGPSVLCCHGKIGSGKTILCTNVINHLFLRKQERTIITFFLVQEDVAESLLAETMLRSILSQAITASELSTLLISELAKLLDKPYASISEWTSLLQTVVARSNRVYIIVDGLDACSVPERRAFLRELSTVVNITPHLHVLLCGRDSMLLDAAQVFTVAEISTASAGLRADISLYVEQLLEENSQNGDMVISDPSLRKLVAVTLKERADNMFLLVVYLVQELCVASYTNDVMSALATLPRDLEGVYLLMLERIFANNTMVEVVRKALHWVMAARRPLTVEELQEAISIDVGQPYSMAEKRIPNFERIILWSGNLLQWSEEEPRTIRVAHSTIRDFLMAGTLPPELKFLSFDQESMDNHLGEICLTYLDFNDFKTEIAARKDEEHISLPPLALAGAALRRQSMAGGIANVVAKLATLRTRPAVAAFNLDITRYSPKPQQEHQRHAFLKYAQANWLTHTAGFTERRSAQWDLFRRIIREGHPFASWSGHKHPKPTKAQMQEFLENNDHYAMFLVAIEHWLLLDDRCPTCRCACLDVKHRPLREMKIINKHIHGRNVNELRIFLSVAQRGGALTCDILTILLTKTSMSQLATFESEWTGDHWDKVELLRASECGDFSRIISFCSRQTRFIARPGRAELRPRTPGDSELGKWLDAALIQATKFGQKGATMVLIGHGADYEAQDGQGCTALHHASCCDRLSIIKMLIKHGADVNREVEVTAFTALPTERIPEYHRSYTALYMARCMQHPAVVERLLLANATDDVKTPNFVGKKVRKEDAPAHKHAGSSFTPGPMT